MDTVQILERLATLEDEYKALRKEADEMKEQIGGLQENTIELQRSFAVYNSKMDNLESLLKEIGADVKTVTAKIVQVETKQELVSANNLDTSTVLHKVLDNNGKVLTWVVMCIIVGLLVLIGVNVADIGQFFM